jgi:putative pyruvate formate lyase activating enzyme
MGKKDVRFFVTEDGKVAIEDLSPLEMKILVRMGVTIREDEKDGDATTQPMWASLRKVVIDGPLPNNLKGLEALHQTVMQNLAGYMSNGKSEHGFSIFELKKRILESYLRNCHLCGLDCGGIHARQGHCPILRRARYHHHFVHLGEEKEIGRTLVIELTGCNLSCRFCQKGELIEGGGHLLGRDVWSEIRNDYDVGDFGNISFLGGNPDQSITGVLRFMERAPAWAKRLPIVWHTNGYSSPSLYRLLDGIVDIWVIDFKYFDDTCAVACSDAPDYVEYAKQALQSVVTHSPYVPVIVRHLMLPGHFQCCQKPLIDYLETLKSHIILHLMDQYRPLWRVTPRETDLNRTITLAEKERVTQLAVDKDIPLTQPRSV